MSAFMKNANSGTQMQSSSNTAIPVECTENTLEKTMTDELDKCKQQLLIRMVASYIVEEERPPEQLWADYSKKMGYDCQPQWERLRGLTLEKLNKLLISKDNSDSESVQLSDTDWLLVNKVLVHENVNLIAQDSATGNMIDYKELLELFELVQRFQIETLRGEQLAKAWHLIVTIYNTHEQRGSLMLLQRRWYQMKAATRERFYKVWRLFRGDPNLLTSSEQISMPTQLQMKIAMRYPKFITEPLPKWKELIEQKLIVLDDQIENVIEDIPKTCDEIKPDIMSIKSDIDTIDLKQDSDSEDLINTQIEKQAYINRFKSIDEDNSIKHEFDIDVSIKEEGDEDGLANVEIVKINHVPEVLIHMDDNLDPSQRAQIKVNNAPLKHNIESAAPCTEFVSNGSPDKKELCSVSDIGIHVSVDSSSQGMLPKVENMDEDVEPLFEDENATNSNVLSSNLNLMDDGIKSLSDSTEYVEEDVKHDICVPNNIIGISPEFEIQTDVNNSDCNASRDDSLKYFKLLIYPVRDTTKLNQMTAFNHTSPSNVKDSPCKTINVNDKSTTQSQIDEKVKISSYLFQKPKKRFYDPVKLCNNPDFNTVLKKLSKDFLSSERNMQLLNMCKLMTVDIDKRFESKLVNGVLYLQLDCSDIEPSDETERDTDIKSKQTVLVVPSAMPVQSVIVYNMMLRTKMNANNATTPSQKTREENVLPERNKVINLPDIADVRHLNQQLLVAEIAPIQLHDKHKPPIKIVPFGNINDSNKNIALSNQYQNDVCSNELLVPSDNYSVDTSINDLLQQDIINKPVVDVEEFSNRKKKQKKSVNDIYKTNILTNTKNVLNSFINQAPVVEDALLTLNTLKKLLYVMNNDKFVIRTVTLEMPPTSVTTVSHTSQTVENEIKSSKSKQENSNDEISKIENYNDDISKQIESTDNGNIVKHMENVKVLSTQSNIGNNRYKNYCLTRDKIEETCQSQPRICSPDTCKSCRNDVLDYKKKNRINKKIECISEKSCKTTNPLISDSYIFIQNTFDSENNLSDHLTNINENLTKYLNKEEPATSNRETTYSLQNNDNVESVNNIHVENISNLDRLQAKPCIPCSSTQSNESVNEVQKQIVIDSSQNIEVNLVQNDIPGKNTNNIFLPKRQQIFKNILDSVNHLQNMLDTKNYLLNDFKSIKENLQNSSDKGKPTTFSLEMIQSLQNNDNLKSVNTTQIEEIANIEMLQAKRGVSYSNIQPNVSIDKVQRQIVIDDAQCNQTNSPQNDVPRKNIVSYLNRQQIVENISGNLNLLENIFSSKNHLSNNSTSSNEILENSQDKEISTMSNLDRIQFLQNNDNVKSVNTRIEECFEKKMLRDKPCVPRFSTQSFVSKDKVQREIIIDGSQCRQMHLEDNIPRKKKTDKQRILNNIVDILNHLEYTFDSENDLRASSGFKNINVNHENSLDKEKPAMSNIQSTIQLLQNKDNLKSVNTTQVKEIANLERLQGKPCILCSSTQSNVSVDEVQKQIVIDGLQNSQMHTAQNSISSKDIKENKYLNNQQISQKDIGNPALEKNKILVTNVQFPKSKTVTSTDKTNSFKIKLSDSIQLIMSPSGEFMYSVDPGVVLDAEEMTKETELRPQIAVRKEFAIAPEPLNALKKELQLVSEQRSMSQKEFNIDVIEKDMINKPDVVLSDSQSITDANNKSSLELFPVQTFAELEYAYENNGSFFKLDFEKCIIVRENICIMKDSKPDDDIVSREQNTNNFHLINESNVMNINNKKKEGIPINTLSGNLNSDFQNKLKRKQSLNNKGTKMGIVNAKAPLKKGYFVDSLDFDLANNISNSKQDHDSDSLSNVEPFSKKIKIDVDLHETENHI